MPLFCIIAFCFFVTFAGEIWQKELLHFDMWLSGLIHEEEEEEDRSKEPPSETEFSLLSDTLEFGYAYLPFLRFGLVFGFVDCTSLIWKFNVHIDMWIVDVF